MARHRLALSKLVLLALLAAALFTKLTAPAALIAGVIFAFTLRNPWPNQSKKLVTPGLQLAIVGMGAGMNLSSVLRVGANGVLYTVVGIVFTLFLGEVLLRKLLRSDSETSFLITVGTAICGGSAIAAVSGAIGSRTRDVSVALATVFLLNAVALFIFPILGHLLHLDEARFGLWCALAIHDTSSVVGAAMLFGPHALQIATTVKLARALWIVPLTLAAAQGWIGPSSGKGRGPVKKPWFIGGFLAMSALVTYAPSLEASAGIIYSLSKRFLVVTLVLIGANLSREALKGVGFKPLVHGISLWVLVSAASLAAIGLGWIS